MISDAVNEESLSRILGYKIKKGNFAEVSPNLPQRIALIGEANTDNQATLDTEPKQITSAQQAGELYGYGSPLHINARILFPKNSSGIGGIPVIVYPQEEVDGATEKILTLTPTGVATANGTHYIVLAGRDGMDGEKYAINIEIGDTTAEITAKIADAVNNVLGAPCIVVDTDYESTFTSKWKGLTAEGIKLSVETNGNDLGITYAVDDVQAGSGTPSIEDALELFGNAWVTIVLNSYGAVDSIMDSLEEFNGIPDPDSPTGRFRGIVMKPFIAITGSVADDPSSITDGRKDDVTIAIAPAPGSDGLAMEAAANMVVEFARCSQDTPHLDVAGRAYKDMPTPKTNIGSMMVYENRDAIMKKGCSTVDLVAGKYVVQDFITTYHPVGENPPQFRYCRNLMIDFNVRYSYYLLEQTYVIDHAIAKDSDTVNVEKVVKPKQWKQVLSSSLAEDLGNRALIVDVPFTQDSISVSLGTANPDRFETTFKYKRSGFVRVASTDATAGFNTGTLN